MTEVYRNLNKRLWSVREGGKVVRHVDSIALMDVSFHVSEAARQRAIRLGQRAVMAWARGIVIDAPLQRSSTRITFDPFDGPDFMMEDWPIYSANLVHFDRNGRCWGVL